MVIDALFDNALVYNVFYQIDIVTGQNVTLIVDKMPEDAEVYAKGDKILDIDDYDNLIKIKTLRVGKSKVRIESNKIESDKVSVYREILINVVDSVGLPATSLNATFDKAVPR